MNLLHPFRFIPLLLCVSCGPSPSDVCIHVLTACDAVTDGPALAECYEKGLPDESRKALNCALDAWTCEEAWACVGFTENPWTEEDLEDDFPANSSDSAE